MRILVLMAGRGDRFLLQAEKDPRFRVPKPLIEVNGLTILEWTLRSFPFELASRLFGPLHLTFAVRSEHLESYELEDFLKSRYGESISLVPFSAVTRGNLETALISSSDMPSNEPLFLLDSDNGYHCNNLLEAILKKRERHISAAVCYFKPEHVEQKWACILPDEAGLVKEIGEKDPGLVARGGLPLVGTFYYDSVATFQNLATEIINSGEMTGPETRREFYVSQTIKKLVGKRAAVLAHQVSNVIPLGTPEDLYYFEGETLVDRDTKPACNILKIDSTNYDQTKNLY